MKLKLNRKANYKHKWAIKKYMDRENFKHWELYVPEQYTAPGYPVRLHDKRKLYTYFECGERLYQGPPK